MKLKRISKSNVQERNKKMIRSSEKKMSLKLLLAAVSVIVLGIKNNTYAWDYFDGTYIWSFHWISSNTCAELEGSGGRGVSYGVNYTDGHGVYADMIETGGAPVGTIAVPTNVCINTNGRGGGVLEWYPVTSLGRNVFNGCGGLTDISIPACITNVGANCFKGCVGLTTLHLPESIVAIGTYAFQNCSNLMSLTLPQNLTQIGRGVFQDCTCLNAIELPAGVDAVPNEAFQRCRSLASISMPNGITSIGIRAFRDCVSLEYVIIPESVTEVGSYAFTGCTGLKKAFVPISLQGKLGVVNNRETAFDDFSVVEYYYGSAADIQLPPDSVTSDPVSPEPVTSGHEMIEPGDITEAFVAPRAVTLQGAVYDGDGAMAGIVELKLGKVNKGKGKVSGTVTTLDGKKHAIKSYNVTEIGGAASKAVSLEVKDFDKMNVTIGGTRFAGSMGGYHVQSADVGGDWTKDSATVHLAATSAALPAGTREELLPNGETAKVTGGKWTFAKAAGVKWAKPKKDAALPDVYDETSQKGLIIDTDNGKTNKSGLKLTYTPKKGTFKGSFKVYALEGAGKATKLKKYTVNVSGVVVGGIGYGTATCKKPMVSWSVTVE